MYKFERTVQRRKVQKALHRPIDCAKIARSEALNRTIVKYEDDLTTLRAVTLLLTGLSAFLTVYAVIVSLPVLGG